MTGSIWTGDAPAKVNLRLRILAREESGFHQLETVFQTLELADRVRLELIPDEGVELEVVGVPAGDLGPVDRNLAVRAARGFQGLLAARERRAPGVRIHLEKRVPRGAGLGGGSSDAAAVLRGLAALTGAASRRTELLAVAGEIGSDVPFFLSDSCRALAWGRGGRMLPLPPLPVREVVVVAPPDPLSTAVAFRMVAETRGHGGGTAHPKILEGVWQGGWEAVSAEAVNDFEPIVFQARPELKAIRDALAEAGARPALLSGSGSALFGVFRTGEDADRAEGILRKAFPAPRVLRTRTRPGEDEGPAPGSRERKEEGMGVPPPQDLPD